MSGKVLDAGALTAWAHGHLGMATWSSIASDLGLSTDPIRLQRVDASIEIDRL